MYLLGQNSFSFSAEDHKLGKIWWSWIFYYDTLDPPGWTEEDEAAKLKVTLGPEDVWPMSRTKKGARRKNAKKRGRLVKRLLYGSHAPHLGSSRTVRTATRTTRTTTLAKMMAKSRVSRRESQKPNQKPDRERNQGENRGREGSCESQSPPGVTWQFTGCTISFLLAHTPIPA